jgi:hypothetical protein
MSSSFQLLEQEAFGLLECRNSDQEGQEPFSHLGEVTLGTIEAATSALLSNASHLGSLFGINFVSDLTRHSFPVFNFVGAWYTLCAHAPTNINFVGGAISQKLFFHIVSSAL